MVAIYALKCTVNGFAYVGCTKGIGKRMREHRCLLRNGKHIEPALQRDWDEHGEKSFVMVELFRLPDDADLPAKRVAELDWMARFKADGKLYNRNETSFTPTAETTRKGIAVCRSHIRPEVAWGPEANLKRRLAQLGKPKGHGAKISATKQAKRLARLAGN